LRLKQDDLAWASVQECPLADTSETPMTGDDRFAKVPVRLQELLEISLEAFAIYTATAEALSSTLESSGHGN
jgi:hypothetical protein